MKKIFLLSILLIYSGVIFAGERTKNVSPSNESSVVVSAKQTNTVIPTVKDILAVRQSITELKNKARSKTTGENLLSTIRYVKLTGSDVTGDGTAGNPWRTIQHAVANSNSGDEIWVGTGTFIETGQIVINKNLWIYGDGIGVTVVQKAEDTGNPSSGDNRAWFLVTNAVTQFDLSDITLDGFGKNITIGILSKASNIYLYQCEIKNIGWLGGGPPTYEGRGICNYGGTANIWNCSFENIGRIGVFTFYPNILTNIVECTYTGKGSGDYLDYGFEVGGGAELDVYSSSISNCIGVASSDGSTSAGILATTFYGTGTSIGCEWNTITNCETAVAVGYSSSDLTYAVVRNNNLAGNNYAIWNTNPSNLTYAPLNWYSSNLPATVASVVSTGVDYSPWLDSGNDIDLSNSYFDPDLSVIWVDDDSPRFYPALGTIQEGIDLVSGSTVYVAAGTYTEQILVNNQNVDIIGDGKSTTFINAPAAMSITFTTSYDHYCIVGAINNSTLNISGFTIDGLSNGNSHYRYVGVGFRNSGGSVVDCDIKNIQETPFSGTQHGVGVYLFNNDGTARSFSLTGCTIQDFQKNATAIISYDVLSVNISNNTIIGKGATPLTAQNGIQIYGDNITGNINNNSISGIEWIYPGSGTAWVASSILNFYGDLNFTSNTVTNGHLGLYNIDGTSSISNNTFTIVNNGSYAFGIVATDPPSAVPSPFDEEFAKLVRDRVIESLVTVVLNNNTVQFSGTNNANTIGIEVDAGYGPDDIDFTATNNTVTGFDIGFGIYKCTSGCSSGLFTNIDVNYNQIFGNTTYGIESNVDYLLTDAKNNWWGHPSGPFDNKTLPNTPNYNNLPGLGDAVTPYVDYIPWIVNTPSTPYKLYLSNSATVIDSIIYPNDSWPKPWEPNPDPGSGYPGDLGIDWGFLSSTDYYIVPEVGSFFGASTITVEWDNTQYSFGSVTNGNIYSSGYFNTLMVTTGTTTRLTIDAGLFNVNQTTVSGGYIAKVSLNLLKTGYAPVNFYANNFRYYDGLGGQYPVYFTDKNAKVKNYLGDVATPTLQSTGDGKVDINDLNLWALSYWSGVTGYAPGLTYYKAKYDIGPTSTTTVYGMPVTDYKIQFEDLVIFSMSYGLSQNNMYPKIAPVPETPVIVSVGQATTSAGKTVVPIFISGAVQDLRAASLIFSGSFGKFISAEKGELLNSYTTPVMVMSRADGNTVYVDLSLVGADVQGLNQEGQLVLLTFEGNANVRLSSADLRNTANSTMLVKLGDNTRGIPTEFGLSQNYPNPFNPATVISYQVPVQAAVKIDVFNAVGEKVETLVNEVKEPGYYEVTWNAASMTSGVYFFRINAGDFSAVKKMMLMK